MKKYIISISLLSIVILSSCLKDTRFDSGQNGILNTEVKGVALPQAKALTSGMLPKDSASFTSTLTSQVASQTISEILISIEAIDLPTTDVKVKVVLTPSLISSAFKPFAVGSVIVPTEVIIKAGQANATIPVTFPNSSGFDPAFTYGLGLSLQSVDGSYIIAGNKKNILVAFSIKNAYAATYDALGYFYHPSSPRDIDRVVTLTTVNGTTSKTTLGDLANFINLTVDANNNVTVTDIAGPVGGTPTGNFTSLLGGYAPFVGSNPLIYTNKYDPVTKTFYLRYGYQSASGYRIIEETLTRK